MPRVLRILNRLIIGGPTYNASYLTKYMAEEYETLLLVGGSEPHEQEATHVTDRLGLKPKVVEEMKKPLNPIEDFKAYWRIRKIIRDFKPDIVHTHVNKPGVVGRLAAFHENVPVVVHTVHGHYYHGYFGKAKTRFLMGIDKYLASKSDGIIAISEQQKHDLGSVYHLCDPKKIEVIPLGLDLDVFKQGQDLKRQTFRQRYGIADDELAIGIIGRIVPIKNHALFVDAIARVRDEATGKKLRFVIVGDGDIREDIQKRLAAARISAAYMPDGPCTEEAILTSWIKNVDGVLAGLDIVALTSNNEGTPVSMIEAQAAGRPVVTTNVGGVTDVVVEGETGLIVPPGDVAAFAAALLQLVQNESQRQTFGRRGMVFAQDRFSYRRLVTDMDRYYKQLLASAAVNRGR
jgi:glycosyltransferase involved in cell wall biosynthesis